MPKAPPPPPMDTPELRAFIRKYYPILDKSAFYRAAAKSFPGVTVVVVKALARDMGLVKRNPI